MEAEPIIISKHNLDCSSLENLANDIAVRLGCNIEYEQLLIENGIHHFNVLGRVTVNDNGIFFTLGDSHNDKDSNYNFALVLGDQFITIYDDFLEYIPPVEEQYGRLEEIFSKYGLENYSFNSNFFEQLKKLGADKVYFIKDTFAPELAIPENTTMESYLKTIQKETIFFEVPLTNN